MNYCENYIIVDTKSDRILSKEIDISAVNCWLQDNVRGYEYDPDYAEDINDILEYDYTGIFVYDMRTLVESALDYIEENIDDDTTSQELEDMLNNPYLPDTTISSCIVQDLISAITNEFYDRRDNSV